ncbi:universal stress protein [Solwaraspora sp. WMMD406]|uniref:universal stress protein n=1 Tax=Solwaraspora sp. WMMD406 TaxID=3016095 RepID=UPI002417F26D|nr:universal stress protein [Solwaraspora sp. WMMD406]MDG4766841.1 universal stress protein [Solwaraspora sp. WMMD406]
MSDHPTPVRDRIAVGVDDSASAWAAVALAAREAAVQHRPLRLVHAMHWTADAPSTGAGDDRPDTQHLLEKATRLVDDVAPDVEVSVEVSESTPTTALLRESRMASLVVLGDGDLARWTCLPLDALAVEVAARADCSVLVARAPGGQRPDPGGPVLVGVDGSAGSERALGLAFDMAAQRGSELTVVRAWESELRWADTSAVAHAELTEAVAPWQEKHPEVTVRLQVVNGAPGRVLIDRSADAGVVVVGARGDHPLRVPLGAVSQAVLHHARCATVIVRECAPPPAVGD